MVQASATERWPQKLENTPENQSFFLTNRITIFFLVFLLVMPKYGGKQNFGLGSFPEVGQKQKTENKERRKKLKVGNNNGQPRIANATSGGARKATWAKRKREKSESW